MKKSLVWGGVLLVLGAVAGCVQAQKSGSSADTGLLYRHHFAGTRQIAAGTNATKLKEVLALDATKAVQDDVLGKLAAVPSSRWPKRTPKNSAELLRPLLDDFVAYESFLEVRGSLSRPEWTLAVALPDDRDRLWNKNVRALAERSKLKAQVTRVGKWTLLGLSAGEPALLAELAKKTKEAGRPLPELANGAILELEADTPRLATVLPVLAPYQFPPARFTVLGRGENLRTEGKILPKEKVAWKFELWKIPTNRVPESIIGFTVAQGIAPLLKNYRPVAELGLKTYPNQFCAWDLDADQVRTYVAVAVKDATNTMRQIAPNVPKVAQKYLQPKVGQFIWASNQAELHWNQVPWVMPSLRAMREGGQDYVLLSVFPQPRATNPPPAELLAQLAGRKDLAYYDWEITGPRVPHGRQIFQLHNLFARRLLPPEKSPSQQWLTALTRLLGNTITEITVGSEKELDFARKSHIGFTGIELATLALWFDSPSFPFRIDPRPPVPKNPRGLTNDVPRAPTNAPAQSK